MSREDFYKKDEEWADGGKDKQSGKGRISDLDEQKWNREDGEEELKRLKRKPKNERQGQTREKKSEKNMEEIQEQSKK